MLKGRIAYLASRYPGLSLTFIEREIRALRQLGCEIQSLAIRVPIAQDLLSKNHSQEKQQTIYMLDSITVLAAHQIKAFIYHPIRYLRTAWYAQRLSPPGFAFRFRYLAYSCEAVRLVATLRKQTITHMHVHLANNAAMVALLACYFDPSLSYSLSVHGPTEFFNVENQRLTIKISRALFVRCISNYCRAQLMRLTPTQHWPKLHIVHCGIDLKEYATAPRSTSNNCLRLLSVGRLVPDKGFDVLLKACSMLSVNWHLTIIGDGPLYNTLADHISALGLQRSVTLHGAASAEHVADAMGQADIFVLASFAEGIPVVLMEAMAKQCPVIATSVGGVSELITHEQNGLLVPPGSPEAIAEAIHTLHEDHALRNKIAEAARPHIDEEFAIDASVKALQELFIRYHILSVDE